MATKADDGLVVVCDACLCASCWQGEFFCEQYRSAGTTKLPISKLKEMAQESPHYWEEGR